MKLKLLLFITTISMSLSSTYAQNIVKAGKVILNSGKEINGYINTNFSDSIYTKCVFKETQASQEIVYRPYELLGYEIFDGKKYKSLTIHKQVFVEILAEGKVSLYLYSENRKNRHFIFSEKFGLDELTFSKKIIDQSDSKNRKFSIDPRYSYTYEKKSNEHLKILKRHFSDKPEMFKEVDKYLEPSTDTYLTVVDMYNRKVSSETNIEPFKRRVKSFRFEIGHSLGIVSINQNGVSGLATERLQPYAKYDKLGFTFGLDFNVYFPATTESFFLHSGFIYYDSKPLIPNVKIPFHVGFCLPKGIIRPEVTMGINIWPSHASTTGINLGLKIFLNDNLNVRLKVETDFYSEALILVPEKYVLSQFTVGLSYKL